MVDIKALSDASLTAADNLAVDGQTMAEGWLPSQVNNNVRSGWSVLAAFYKDLVGVGQTIGGTANAITLTVNQEWAALDDDLLLMFKHTNGPNSGATTINVTPAGGGAAFGAKAIRLPGDTALTAGAMRDNGVYMLRYDTTYNAAAGAWVLLNPTLPDAVVAASISVVDLFIEDQTGANERLNIQNFSNQTNDRTLTIDVADGDRALDFNGGDIVGPVGSGTYTPTFTNTTNVAASTPGTLYYSRSGDIVTVFGAGQIDPTAAVNTVMGISLPIPSNIGSAGDVAGFAIRSGSTFECFAILGDAANNRATLNGLAVDTANHTIQIHFSYPVI